MVELRPIEKPLAYFIDPSRVLVLLARVVREETLRRESGQISCPRTIAFSTARPYVPMPFILFLRRKQFYFLLWVVTKGGVSAKVLCAVDDRRRISRYNEIT